MAKKTPEEIARAWFARATRLRESIPTNFRQGVRKAAALSQTQLSAEVYAGGGANTKSGNLLRKEMAVFVSDSDAHLTNRAKTNDGTYYAWLISKGIPARKAPTLSGGKQVYAWMKNPMTPRPRSKSGWRAARKAGQAILATKIRAVRGRPWRAHVMQAMMNAIRQGLQRGKQQAITGA